VIFAFVSTQAKATWSGDIFVGYNQSSGNTDKGQANVSGEAKKAWDGADTLAKFSAFYSESDNRMDGQKWDALIKHNINFGDNDEFYSTYQILVDHDKFSDIDYRITPSVGLGYHFSREEDWTWNADISVGYEMTEFNSNQTTEDEVAAVIGHTFAKTKIFENAYLSEDLTVIPGLESGAGVRAKSTTALTNRINDKMDLEIKYILDYDSEPAAGKTTTDKQIVAGLKYKF